MSKMRRYWLATGATLIVAAGFVAFDYRDKFRSVGSYANQTRSTFCAILPRFNLEGRYTTGLDNPTCSWDMRVGPKQTFSGYLKPGEHGRVFFPDNASTAPSQERFRRVILYGPTWAMLIDDEAARSFEHLNGKREDVFGPAYRVTFQGWRTSEPGHHWAARGDHPYLLFVDEFTRVEPLELR